MSQNTQAPAPPRSTSHASSPGALERAQAWRVASNLFVSFGFAWAGITYAFRTQRNFKIHVFMGLFALSLALILQLPPVEIAVMGLTVGGVMTMELLNTALESVVDLTVQQTYHELAKVAKDCAAGAVLISALVSIIVAVSLLLPPLLDRLLALI
ncbi:MAG: diacylglycerol kinase family protein [Synechococcales cyanobacterium RU_4_20]|nr:diacylglycerol kinase family protein [Synechococcales cyanobacterium RU_4_20]NJR71097.1 diacylglycerol kinase family protein [Synechococcales cyanobacterium CRU_2_2]